jgi:chromosome segregation ATPase
LSDDPIREFPQATPFEARVLAEFAAIRGELATMRGEFATMRGELATMRGQIETIRADIATLNARQEKFENRLDAIEGRLESLEEKVDSRLKETRPIWESVQLAVQKLDVKFDKIIQELYELHADVRLHDIRLLKLESR